MSYLKKYNIMKKISVYVKDEQSNLNTMIFALKAVVTLKVWRKVINALCFGHAFSMTCQYAITNEKVCKNLTYVSIKITLKNLQKCIT